jgi:hypothetical protein
MAAAMANFIPFAFAVLDTVALLMVFAFIVYGLVLAVLGRPGWKTVLIATASYVVWANALVGVGLSAFNLGAYVLVLADIAWEVVTGGPQSGALRSSLRLLLVSFSVVSLVPTLAAAAIQRAAERRVW